MKFIILLAFTFALLTISPVGFSQVQLGLHGSRLQGTGSSQWGFGGHAKVLLADKVAIGIGVRGYPKDIKTENTTIGGTNYKIARGNTIVPVTGSVDYYFGESVLRPYVGADVGAYFTQYVFSMTQNNGNNSFYDTKNKRTYFGAAPKVGLNVEMGPVGIFGQAGYNLLFGSGDKDDIIVPGVTTGIDAKATNKFWTFDMGIFLKLGRKK